MPASASIFQGNIVDSGRAHRASTTLFFFERNRGDFQRGGRYVRQDSVYWRDRFLRWIVEQIQNGFCKVKREGNRTQVALFSKLDRKEQELGRRHRCVVLRQRPANAHTLFASCGLTCATMIAAIRSGGRLRLMHDTNPVHIIKQTATFA